MPISKLLLLGAVTILLSGCASIIDGGDKSIQLSSNPQGATVTVRDRKGREVCRQTTPTIVQLRRAAGFDYPEHYQITFQMPDHYDATAKVDSVINGWYFGNLVFGGVVGMIVDMGTGACFTLGPRNINVNLVAVDPSLTSADEIKAAQEKANPKPKHTPVVYSAKH